MDTTISVLAIAAALGSGLVAGIFFAFSNFVMPALGRIAPESGIAAVGPDSAEAAPVWSRYLADWIRWNHVRTIASLVASAAFVLAVV